MGQNKILLRPNIIHWEYYMTCVMFQITNREASIFSHSLLLCLLYFSSHLHFYWVHRMWLLVNHDRFSQSHFSQWWPLPPGSSGKLVWHRRWWMLWIIQQYRQSWPSRNRRYISPSDFLQCYFNHWQILSNTKSKQASAVPPLVNNHYWYDSTFEY